MDDVSRIPVPGQTMEVDADLSEGEVEITLPKKKEARSLNTSSPTKRGAAETEGVSVEVLKMLFKEQTQELKGNLREELAAAIQASENKMTESVSKVQTELENKMEKGSQDIAVVKDQQDKLLKRVLALEGRSAAPAASWQAAASRPPTVLVGGWKTDTKRSVIVADIADALQKAGAKDLIDQAPWVPKARRSICLSEMRLRPGESEADREQRTYAVISKLNDPCMVGQKLASGNTLWATVSRPSTERGGGPHASKIRRLLHMVQADFDEIDSVYDSGSIWHKDVLVGSVDKPANGSHVKKGKMGGSWIDLVALAKTTGKKIDELEALWQQIVN